MNKERSRLESCTHDVLPDGGAEVRFVVTCDSLASDVLDTAKRVLSVAIDLSGSGTFEVEKWEGELPTPFVKRCKPIDNAPSVKEEIALGRKPRWSVFMFMNAFRPDLLPRQWTWWDAHVVDENHIHVSVLIEEWPFAWESLRWLFVGSGATDVTAEE